MKTVISQYKQKLKRPEEIAALMECGWVCCSDIALGYPPAGRTQIGAAIAINAGPRVVGAAFLGK